MRPGPRRGEAVAQARIDRAMSRKETAMARYLVTRTFQGGLEIPTDPAGAATVGTVVDNNAAEGVTWVHSYVTPDRQTTFCIYDGPDPESIRRAATRNGLPIDSISEVRVLDPYFYLESA